MESRELGTCGHCGHVLREADCPPGSTFAQCPSCGTEQALRTAVVVSLPAELSPGLVSTLTPPPPRCKVKTTRSGIVISYPDTSPRRIPALGGAAVLFAMAGAAYVFKLGEVWVPLSFFGAVFGLAGLAALRRSPKTLALFHDLVSDGRVSRGEDQIVRAVADGNDLRGVHEDGSQVSLGSNLSAEQARWMAEQLNAALAREHARNRPAPEPVAAIEAPANAGHSDPEKIR